MTLGEKISNQRKVLGYTQIELADLIGVKSSVLISNWENGLSKPDVEKVSKLCHALKCPASYFIDESQKSDLTADEVTILQKLRSLDDLGKKVVILNLDFQFERCAAIDTSGNFT